jgi:hypothetical protein
MMDDEIKMCMEIEVAKILLGNPNQGIYIRQRLDARYPGNQKYIAVPRLKLDSSS